MVINLQKCYSTNITWILRCNIQRIVALILFSVIWKLIYTVSQYVSRKSFLPFTFTVIKSSDLSTLKVVCSPWHNVYIGQQLHWKVCYKTRLYQKIPCKWFQIVVSNQKLSTGRFQVKAGILMRITGSQNKNRRGSEGVRYCKKSHLGKKSIIGGGSGGVRSKLQYREGFEKNDSTHKMSHRNPATRPSTLRKGLS